MCCSGVGKVSLIPSVHPSWCKTSVPQLVQDIYTPAGARCLHLQDVCTPAGARGLHLSWCKMSTLARCLHPSWCKISTACVHPSWFKRSASQLVQEACTPRGLHPVGARGLHPSWCKRPVPAPQLVQEVCNSASQLGRRHLAPAGMQTS